MHVTITLPIVQYIAIYVSFAVAYVRGICQINYNLFLSRRIAGAYNGNWQFKYCFARDCDRFTTHTHGHTHALV